MLRQLYDHTWEIIDPALYAVFASIMFSVWIAIF